METVLAVDTYAPLREHPGRCDVMNVLAPGARQIVEAMIDDVLKLMPNVQRFHLGGDEAWTFGTHPQTRTYAQEHGKDRLYLQHVEPMLDRLARRGIRPLLWHDMMIHWHDAALQALGAKADLVVWGYVGHPNDVNHHFNTRYIERFHQLNMPLWAAGAYKGADGMSNDLPHLQTRITNAQAWRELDERFHFHGLIATAWSRYSTHRVQNEPIEGALDAMVCVGHLFRFGRHPDESAVHTILQQAGEAERYEQCRAALENLARLRQAIWDGLQQDQQNQELARQHAQWCSSGISEGQYEQLSRYIEELDESAASVRSAMASLVELVWIEEYLNVRIEPLRAAVAGMRMKQIPMHD